MRGLNYHHLYYFWVTARLGSLRAAAQRLHLAPQTMSDQIKLLEERLNHPLFERQGRRLVLTVEGHLHLPTPAGWGEGWEQDWRWYFQQA